MLHHLKLKSLVEQIINELHSNDLLFMKTFFPKNQVSQQTYIYLPIILIIYKCLRSDNFCTTNHFSEFSLIQKA